MNDKTFCKRDAEGLTYAGDHLLIELWGAQNLTDPVYIQEALEACAQAAKTTILHSYYHPFGPNQGVSGATIISESHISIHTWPEYSFASIDCYMCGDCDVKATLPIIEEKFCPTEMETQIIKRGFNLTREGKNERVAL